jgi:hypothetical protein
MSKKGGRGTPDELDYLFERDIIDEEDYVSFWRDYWRLDKEGDKEGQQSLVNDYISIAQMSFDGLEDDEDEDTRPRIAGVVTKNKSDAQEQARIIGGKVVRRDRKGRFSKRGRRYQAVAKGGRRDKRRTEATEESEG